MPANGYVVVRSEHYEDGFSLENLDGRLYLSAADAQGELTGHIAGVRFRSADLTAPVGVHETSVGRDFTSLAAATLGTTNSAPRAPEVAIHEIHYHPADGLGEFVELHRSSGEPIDISGWRLSGIANGEDTGDFILPPGAEIPRGGYLVVVPLDPELFRQIYDVPESAIVIGPYRGALDNAGERLRLFRPRTDNSDAWTLVDEVRFNDATPWPLEADGAGSSLEKRIATDYGNEPLHWGASTVFDGTPGAENSIGGAPPPPPPVGGLQRPGDISQDGDVNLVDALVFLNYLFEFAVRPLPCGDGSLEDPGNRALLDANGDARTDLADATHLLNYLFLEGPTHAQGDACRPFVGCAPACQ